MKTSKLPLFILFLPFFLGGPVFSFSTNPDTTFISRSFDKIHAFRTESVTVTVIFENNGDVALRGFYYIDQIPQGLTVNTVNVKVDGNDVSNYTEEFGLVGDVYDNTIPYRLVLETPGTFDENNPIGTASILEIVYSVSPDQLGTFNLDEFHWVGYYPEAADGHRANFGYSEDIDKQTVTFINTPPLANNDSTTTSENTPITIDVLANDSDPDGSIDPTTLLILNRPMDGHININNDWTVTYTPWANFNGTDSFTYTVQDNDEAFSNEAIVIVSVSEVNSPPVVEAGPDQTLTLPSSAILDGSVTDDGVPDPPGVLATTWSKVSGTGTVTFADASAVDTTVSFSEAGTYVLHLTADDGELIASDDTTITVNPEPDLDPPDPDPMTWQMLPHPTGPYSISMTATTATDLSGVEYYFECIAGGGNDSGWQDNTTYEDTGLYPETLYTYRVKARDKSPNQNETAWSTEESATTEPPPEWTELTYDDFESGWGNYTNGGRDCTLFTRGTHAHQGSNAADIQDNSGVSSSFYYKNGVDVDTPGYIQIKVEFWFKTVSMESGEDFWVQYYDGSTWHTVASYASGTDFINDEFDTKTVYIDESPTYAFPTDMKIRFMCDASANKDDVYIDEIRISAKK